MPRARERLAGFGWKLAAVVLAYAFWLAVVEEPLVIRQLDVPVHFENLGPTLALVRDRPSSIVVRVQAPEPVAKDLQPTDIQARVDLGGLGRGKHHVGLGPDSESIMPRRFGVKVIEVYPPAIELTLEPKVAAEVSVTPVFTGSPEDGFEVAGVEVEPTHVRIEGPETAVKATTQARTREIALGGRRAPFQQTVLVDVVSPDVFIVGDPRVRVSVNVTERTGERVFSDIPVAFLHSPDEARATPRAVRATVRGPSRILAQLSREDILAWVDLEGLKPRVEDYHPKVHIEFTRDLFRERLKVVGASPDGVAVRITPARSPRSQPRAARDASRGG